MRLDDRLSRRVLLALVTDDPEQDGGWVSDERVWNRTRNRPLLVAQVLAQVLARLIEQGAVEKRWRPSPEPHDDEILIEYRLTGTGLVRALWASRWPDAWLLSWWYRRRDAAHEARQAR